MVETETLTQGLLVEVTAGLQAWVCWSPQELEGAGKSLPNTLQRELDTIEMD